METNVHVFEYVAADDTPLMVRVFVNGVTVYAGSDVAATAVRYLYAMEINFKAIQTFRWSKVPVEKYFDHEDTFYADIHQEYPEEDSFDTRKGSIANES